MDRYPISVLTARQGNKAWRLLGIALVVLAAYIPWILFTGLPDQLLLFPTTNHIATGNAIRRTVPFEQGVLEIWTAQSRLAKTRDRPDVLLRFYGNADRADRLVALEAELWADRAVEIWGVNYPGYGGSTGPARLSRIGPAALAAFDALKQIDGNRPIIVFGTSIGTTAALDIAARRSVTGLILHNPPPLKQMILRQFGWWNLWLLAGPVAMQIPADLDNISNAGRAHARAVFLLAEQDEIVAPRFQRLVVDAYVGEKRIISLPGAGHNSPIENRKMSDLNRDLDWLLAPAKQVGD